MWSAVKGVFQALSAGYQLRNVEGWKNVQLVVQVMAGLVWITKAAGWDPGFTDDQLFEIAAGLSALVAGYWTVATSKKVGVRRRGSQSVRRDDWMYELPRDAEAQGDAPADLRGADSAYGGGDWRDFPGDENNPFGR